MLKSPAAALQRPGGLRPCRARPLRRLVRCYRDGNASGSSPGKATVRFSIPQPTRYGEHVAVVGSFSGWNMQAPVQLKWGEGSVWTGEVELPVGERVEYKYVLVSERNGKVTWQPGKNFVLELGPGGGQTVLVLDDWLGRTHEVRPASTPPAQPEAEAAAAPEPVATVAAELAGKLELASMPEAAAAAQAEALEEARTQLKPAQLEQPALAVVQERVAAAAEAAVVEAVEADTTKAVPAEDEPAELTAAVAEAEAEAETPAAVLAAEQPPAIKAVTEHVPAAEAVLPPPAQPTAADSGSLVLEAASQPVVAPLAVEAAAPASANVSFASTPGAEETPAAPAVGVLAGHDSKPAQAAASELAGDAAPEPVAAVEDSAAAASWASVLAVADQPHVPPQPVAVQPEQEGPAGVADGAVDGVAAAAVVAGPELAAKPVTAAETADAPATLQSLNGSQPPAVHAELKAEPQPAPAQVPSSAPLHASFQSTLKGMAPWARVLLAAALLLSAILLFTKSPWAAIRWALSAI